MIVKVLNPSVIAVVGLLFSKFSFHTIFVGAHCYHSHGHVDFMAVGCDPTISPAPTESPAPSPSPSSFPTDTQAPSHSLHPSVAPTNAPTTSEPSAEPTDSPTESPAPSPSPSSPPSASPTESMSPSMGPTTSPSQSPTSSPSQSPTGPIFLSIVGINLVVHNVTGEREMGVPDVRYFEKETTLFLQKEIEEIPGVFKIEIEDVIVTDQTLVTAESDELVYDQNSSLRRSKNANQTQTDLLITINTVVSVVFNRHEMPDLKSFFEEFFRDPNNQDQLRAALQEDKSFAKGIFIKGEVSASKPLAKKSSRGSTLTGAVLGVVAVVVGSGLLWMWIQTRRMKSADSAKLKNVWTISRSFESDENSADATDKSAGMKISTSASQIGESRDDQQSSESSSQLMYIPTIMPTESNIEVPDTPGTAFAMNGFATPASAQNFATPANGSGFATPASTGGLITPGSMKSTSSSKDYAQQMACIPKLLAPPIKVDSPPGVTLSSSQILKDIGSSTAKSFKIPIPPNILAPIKSPFRRGVKKVEDTEDDGFDGSSLSGKGVVAGKNNIGPTTQGDTNGHPHYRGSSRDFPLVEIGGPSSSPFEVKPTVVAVQEDALSKTHGSRKSKSSHSRSSRQLPPTTSGRPSASNSISRNSTSTGGHGVVDIVDEIAYLYSSDNKFYEKTTKEKTGIHDFSTD